MKQNQDQPLSNYSEDQQIEFLLDITSQMYIQLSILTEQMGSLSKLLWSKGMLTEEDLLAINEDMGKLINDLRTGYGTEED
jgi:hypothetical protein